MQRFFSSLFGKSLSALLLLAATFSTPAPGSESTQEDCQGTLATSLDGWSEATFPSQEPAVTFTFHVPETGTLGLETTSFTSSVSGQLSLLDDSCAPVLSAISWAPSHLVDVLPAGTYHAVVTGLDPGSGFRLQSAFAPLPEGQEAAAPPEEPRDENDGLGAPSGGGSGIPCPPLSGTDIGETTLCARATVLGGQLEGSFENHSVTDHDAYRFEVQSPVTLILWGDGPSDLRGRVLDASNHPLATGALGPTSTQELRTTLPAGTYTLLLESASGTEGAYRVFSLLAPESWQGSSF